MCVLPELADEVVFATNRMVLGGVVTEWLKPIGMANPQANVEVVEYHHVSGPLRCKVCRGCK